MMSGLSDPSGGRGASISENNSHAATTALLTVLSGVEIRSMEVRISITDISTTTTVPALSTAPIAYLCLPYQKAKPNVPKIPKN